VEEQRAGVGARTRTLRNLLALGLKDSFRLFGAGPKKASAGGITRMMALPPKRERPQDRPYPAVEPLAAACTAASIDRDMRKLNGRRITRR